MSSPLTFLDLDVWQRAMDLMVDCCALTRRLPRDERFGLCAQLQRASLSIPSNIAEGNGRRTPGEYLNHLSHARGSLNEVHTLLIATTRIGYTQHEELRNHWSGVQRVGSMLNRLCAALEAGRR